MMHMRRKVGLACSTAGLLTMSAAAQNPTFSLKAVQVNDTVISPTNRIVARPGDAIIVEIYASEWSPEWQILRNWQAGIDIEGFRSGGGGVVLPLGWDRPFEIISCSSDEDCPPEWPRCYPLWEYCVGLDHDPSLGAYIDESRPDFVFEGQAILAVDTMYYVYGGTDWLPDDWPYWPPPKYCATLVLLVADDACGTFTIPFDRDWTFLWDEYMYPITPLELESLTVVTPPCYIVWSDPPSCAIDARQPHNPDGSNPTGWFVIDLYYWMVAPDLDPADFTVTQVGGQDPPPFVAAILQIPSITEEVIRRVVLSRCIEPGTWTTLTHNESGYSVSVGYLPGDVNGDGTAGPEDILALIDRLNSGYHPHFLHWMCDADRSGMCTPADILRVIDLLNGADAYDVWLGWTLPPCPSE